MHSPPVHALFRRSPLFTHRSDWRAATEGPNSDVTLAVPLCQSGTSDNGPYGRPPLAMVANETPLALAARPPSSMPNLCNMSGTVRQ